MIFVRPMRFVRHLKIPKSLQPFIFKCALYREFPAQELAAYVTLHSLQTVATPSFSTLVSQHMELLKDHSGFCPRFCLVA